MSCRPQELPSRKGHRSDKPLEVKIVVLTAANGQARLQKALDIAIAAASRGQSQEQGEEQPTAGEEDK